MRAAAMLLPLVILAGAEPAWGRQDELTSVRNDSITIRIVDADLRLAIQALAQFMDRPLVFGSIAEYRVTLETPRPVPLEVVPDLVRGMLTNYSLQLTDEGTFYRIAPEAPPVQPTELPQAPIQLFVIQLRHARASDVAGTVNALYGRASALGELGAQTRTLSESLQADLVPPAGAAGEAQRAAIVSGTAELTGDVTIIPDARTNTLLVRASRSDFDLIDAVVQQLDIRPLQVLIEVVIAEVRRDRSLGFGVEITSGPRPWPRRDDIEFEGATTGLGLGDFVLRVMKVGGSDLSATLRAAATRGDASILSRPVLLAANNETAEIMIGSQRPFIQVQRALPTDAPIRDQVVQFKDVGTRLTVTPTVSVDGYVTLDVVQEVNAATAEVAFDAPVISTRTIRTQLLVRDGHTAVLGGLADQQRDFTRSGIPFLSSIPLIGGLFGRQVSRTSDTELFVFLSPRVLRTDEDLDDASRELPQRTRDLTERVLRPPPSVPPDTSLIRP